MDEQPVPPSPSFATWRQITSLLGGMVEVQLPSGRVKHGARAYNKAMRRWRLFMPDKRRKPANVR